MGALCGGQIAKAVLGISASSRAAVAAAAAAAAEASLAPAPVLALAPAPAAAAVLSVASPKLIPMLLWLAIDSFAARSFRRRHV